MSSRIESFFYFTKRSGSPSSEVPGAGMLIRYSFPIGLKTCWIRKRFELSRASTIAAGSCAAVLTPST